jgi:hypothetical protein
MTDLVWLKLKYFRDGAVRVVLQRLAALPSWMG